MFIFFQKRSKKALRLLFNAHELIGSWFSRMSQDSCDCFPARQLFSVASNTCYLISLFRCSKEQRLNHTNCDERNVHWRARDRDVRRKFRNFSVNERGQSFSRLSLSSKMNFCRELSKRTEKPASTVATKRHACGALFFGMQGCRRCAASRLALAARPSLLRGSSSFTDAPPPPGSARPVGRVHTTSQVQQTRSWSSGCVQ